METHVAGARDTSTPVRNRAHRVDGLHLRDEARVEHDLANPAPDRAGVLGHVVGEIRYELPDDQVARDVALYRRPLPRVHTVNAVPVRIAVDLDRLKKVRQRGGMDEHI